MKYRLKVYVKDEEKLMKAKYGMRIHYCELEQGSIFGEEDEDTYERSNESVMNYLESLDQHEDMMPKASEEAIESYVFKTDGLFVIACYKNDEDGLPSITIRKEVKGFSYEGIEEENNWNPIIKEEEATISNIDNQSVDYTQLEIAIVGEQLP